MEKAFCLLVCLFLTIPCGARVITVDANGSADFNNIQAAINDANEHDTVVVFPGTYTGEGNRDIDFLGKAITVRSINPSNRDVVVSTVIDCNGSEAEPHSGFMLVSGEDTNAVLAGLTIRNGFGLWEPSGIVCFDARATISNCIISNNVGGGISIGGSQACPTIANCVVSDNTGCGISAKDSGLTLVNSVISGNKGANEGGGVFCYGVETTIRGCVIRGNSADRGGGILFSEHCHLGNLTMANCIISQNRANRGGGAYVTIYADSQVTIANCSIIGNFAADIGGGILSDGFADDSAVSNCILWANRPVQIAEYNQPGSVSLSYTDVQGGWPGLGNIDVDPCFVEPGNWDPNETPADANDDFWVEGDYHLKSEAGRWDRNVNQWVMDANTSRCIDGGNPGCTLGNEPNNANNLRINMGAYGGTAQASVPAYNWSLLADITNDGVVDFVDFAHLAGVFTNEDEQLPADFDRDGGVDYDDLSLLVDDWLKQTSWPH